MGGVRGTHPQQGSTRTTSITVAEPTLVSSLSGHPLVSRRRTGRPETLRTRDNIPVRFVTLVLEIINPHLGRLKKIFRL